MRVSVPVILSFMLLALLTGVFLPVRVRSGRRETGRLCPQGLGQAASVPLHISMPKFGGTTGKRFAEPPAALIERHPVSCGAGGGTTVKAGFPRKSETGVRSLAAARLAIRMSRGSFLILGAVTFERVRITGRAGTGDAYEQPCCAEALTLWQASRYASRALRAPFAGSPYTRGPCVRERPLFFFSRHETSFPLALALYVSGKVSRMVMAFRRLRESSTLTSQKERGNTRSKHVRRSFLWRGTPSKA